MTSRGWLALALVVPAVILERTAYYAARSGMILTLSEGDTPVATAARLFSVLTTGSYVVALLAGALAWGIGPRATAAIGVLIGALGALLVATEVSAVGGIGLVMAGAGIFRPCTWAAAAEIVLTEDAGSSASGGAFAPSARRFAAVTAVSVLLYGAINLGALVASPIAELLRAGGRTALVFGFVARVDMVAFLFIAGAAVVGFVGKRASRIDGAAVGPYRSAVSPGDATPTIHPGSSAGRGLVGLAILAVPTLFYMGASTMSYPRHLAMTAEPRFLLSINPLVVIGMSLLLGVMWVLAAALRWSLAPLTVWGVGLAIFGLGLVPIGIGVQPGAPIAVYAIGALITGVGESAVGPIGYAYAALATRTRAATLVVACFSLASVGANLVFARAESSDAQPALLWAIGILCVASGVAAAVFGKRLHRSFFDPPPPVAT